MYEFLINKFLGEDCHEAVVKNRQVLAWPARTKAESKGEGQSNLLTAILAYDAEYGKTPPGNQALLDFVTADGVKLGIHSTQGFEQELELLGQYPLDMVTPEVDQLIRETVKSTRVDFYLEEAATYRVIISGGLETRKRKWQGPDDAWEYLTTHRATYDLQIEDARLAGLLHEHTADVMDHLRSAFLETAEDRRFLTGLPCLDENVVIGLDGLKYIGIAGQLGHGKSLLLNTLTYNFLKAGKNVLYISLETETVEIWSKLAFLHADYFEKQFQLPSLQNFLLGNKAKVKPEDWANVEILRQDIMERGGLPGKLDVQSFRTWDEIKEHANNNHKTNHFSILIIDYLEHLELPDEGKWQDAEFKKLIKSAHSFTKTFDDHRGIVLITPVAMTKQAADAAVYDDKFPEKPFGITAVRGATQFPYSLDLCIGIHSDDNLKAKSEMLVFGLKVRQGTDIPLTICKVRPMNKLLTQTPKKVRDAALVAAFKQVEEVVITGPEMVE